MEWEDGRGIGKEADPRRSELIKKGAGLKSDSKAVCTPGSTSEVMDQLTRVFESTVIKTALRHTRGRRIDAALRLGIGRNTITRKIQDLRLEDDD